MDDKDAYIAELERKLSAEEARCARAISNVERGLQLIDKVLANTMQPGHTGLSNEKAPAPGRSIDSPEFRELLWKFQSYPAGLPGRTPSVQRRGVAHSVRIGGCNPCKAHRQQ